MKMINASFEKYNVIASNFKDDIHSKINGRLFNCWNSDFCISVYDTIKTLKNGIIKTTKGSKITFWKKGERTEPVTQAEILSEDSCLNKYYKRV